MSIYNIIYTCTHTYYVHRERERLKDPGGAVMGICGEGTNGQILGIQLVAIHAEGPAGGILSSWRVYMGRGVEGYCAVFL